MPTPALPAGNLNLNEVTETSLFALVANFPDYFYYTLKDIENNLGTDEWKTIFPVRRDVLDSYTRLNEAGRINIDRQIHDLTGVETLPNIVELTMWWMGFMHLHEGYHGFRSYRTPSSTKLPDGRVLCVGLLVNDSLWIRPNVDLNRQVVYPPGDKL